MRIFQTTRLQVKFTATKFKARLPMIDYYFQNYGKLLEYEVRTGQMRSWIDDVEAQNTSLAIRNASFVSLCAARDVGSIVGNLKKSIFEDRMKVLGAQVSKLQSSHHVRRHGFNKIRACVRSRGQTSAEIDEGVSTLLW